jgi:hypothetical protein
LQSSYITDLFEVWHSKALAVKSNQQRQADALKSSLNNNFIGSRVNAADKKSVFSGSNLKDSRKIEAESIFRGI